MSDKRITSLQEEALIDALRTLSKTLIDSYCQAHPLDYQEALKNIPVIYREQIIQILVLHPFFSIAQYASDSVLIDVETAKLIYDGETTYRHIVNNELIQYFVDESDLSGQIIDIMHPEQETH